MTTRLFLIRHGATQLTAEDRFSGAENVYLSEEGRAQAERLALRLADDNIGAVYASPLDRTMETARVLAEPHQLPVVARDGLQEIHHGHWEGMSRKEVEAQFPDEYVS
jgi:broad specificity phosphatase PhoE